MSYSYKGQSFMITQLEPDLWELGCDRGLCSGMYEGYAAAATAAKIVHHDLEHEIDLIYHGKPLGVHHLYDGCRGFVEVLRGFDD